MLDMDDYNDDYYHNDNSGRNITDRYKNIIRSVIAIMIMIIASDDSDNNDMVGTQDNKTSKKKQNKKHKKITRTQVPVPQYGKASPGTRVPQTKASRLKRERT